MIDIVKNHPDAGSQLPPEGDYIDLPVGYNVMDNPSINVRLALFTHSWVLC
jgi:cellobiose dehydrogenase (acceptor)